MNKQHITILVLLDLSAAFDTVDHHNFLERLASKVCLSGTALNWFQSYLSGRSQRVSVRGSVSEKFDRPALWCSARLLSWTSSLYGIHQRVV